MLVDIRLVNIYIYKHIVTLYSRGVIKSIVTKSYNISNFKIYLISVQPSNLDYKVMMSRRRNFICWNLFCFRELLSSVSIGSVEQRRSSFLISFLVPFCFIVANIVISLSVVGPRAV